jgi:subtilisin family serine protease
MSRYFFIFIVTVILIGCGSENYTNDKNETADEVPEDIGFSPTFEPYYFEQWYLYRDKTFYEVNNINENAHIHMNDVLRDYSGKGVTIAIIDDGLDVRHEELKKTEIIAYNIVKHNSDVNHDMLHDYHGTAVTGVIASDLNSKGIAGIANQSRIVFLKYYNWMSDSQVIELFRKADELGADIINCSWGTYNVSPAVKETIQDLANHGRGGKGTIIVFATGNDSQDMGNDESAIPEVIAVGSTDRDNLRAWYSNYGAELDVMAPGGYEIGISTIDPMGENGTAEIDSDYLLANDPWSFIGTSASAPIVSGVLALLLEKKPDLTRLEIEKLFQISSDKIGNIEYINDRNQYYGYGKINVANLIDNINDIQ